MSNHPELAPSILHVEPDEDTHMLILLTLAMGRLSKNVAHAVDTEQALYRLHHGADEIKQPFEILLINPDSSDVDNELIQKELETLKLDPIIVFLGATSMPKHGRRKADKLELENHSELPALLRRRLRDRGLTS